MNAGRNVESYELVFDISATSSTAKQVRSSYTQREPVFYIKHIKSVYNCQGRQKSLPSQREGGDVMS